MKKIQSLLPLLFLLCSFPVYGSQASGGQASGDQTSGDVASGSREAASALVQHHRLLEAGDYETAREQIQTDGFRPEELKALPGAMEQLHDELEKGGGFDRIKITQKTRCETDCLLIGVLVLKDGARKPNAWKMVLSGGAWKIAYSRQQITKHLKLP